MFLHFLYLIIVSVLLVVLKSPANMLLDLIKSVHQFILGLLSYVFSSTFTGMFFQQVFALVIICTLVALLLMLGYWLVKRRLMPNFFQILWFIWIILLVTLTLNR